MATAPQIAANRANAQQSTGPKTPEGIENCKYNATRHGLTGKRIVIKGEDPTEYDDLHRALIAEYKPASEVEAVFVEQVAQNWWRLQRARRMEVEVLDRYGPLECLTDPEARKIFQIMTRYVNGIERSWSNAVKALEKIRLERAKEAAEAASAKIGSVSQQPLRHLRDAQRKTAVPLTIRPPRDPEQPPAPHPIP